jgi:hypothetical protein
LLFQVARHLSAAAEEALGRAAPSDPSYTADALANGAYGWAAFLKVGAFAFAAIGVATLLWEAWWYVSRMWLQ